MLIIESVINRYLALDPEMLDKLAQFSGKVIKLDVTGLNKAFYVFPTDRGVQVSMEYEGNADTVLRGSPFALFKMGLVSNTATMLLKGEVEITGDTRLGHQFKNALSQMDIDWAEPLASLLGDGIAYQMQQSGKKLREWSKHTVNSVAASSSEYLQEESRDVVTQAELEMFNQAVDQLRNDADRLSAQIDLLIKSMSTKQ